MTERYKGKKILCKECKSQIFDVGVDGGEEPFKLTVHKKDCKFVKKLKDRSVPVSDN